MQALLFRLHMDRPMHRSREEILPQTGVIASAVAQSWQVLRRRLLCDDPFVPKGFAGLNACVPGGLERPGCLPFFGPLPPWLWPCGGTPACGLCRYDATPRVCRRPADSAGPRVDSDVKPRVRACSSLLGVLLLLLLLQLGSRLLFCGVLPRFLAARLAWLNRRNASRTRDWPHSDRGHFHIYLREVTADIKYPNS